MTEGRRKGREERRREGERERERETGERELLELATNYLVDQSGVISNTTLQLHGVIVSD